MAKRRRRIVIPVRRILMFSFGSVALLGLLAVNLTLFPFSRVPDPDLPDQFETLRKVRREGNWTQVPGPPELGKDQNSTQEPSPPAGPKEPALISFKLNGTTSHIRDFEKLWKPPPNQDLVPCLKPSTDYAAPAGESRGYLLFYTNGGLNQMRTGICDMVAVARIINATLVIPEPDKKFLWQDKSNFSEIFNVKHFIKTLAKDIIIVKKLPKGISRFIKVVKHFKSYSDMDYYQNEIAGMWDEYKVIRAAKADSRLVNNNLPPDLQKLRCRACFEALHFSPQIEAMGKYLVDRMRSFGPYIALHLRYERDMLALSGCAHGLSNAEAQELRKIRENTAFWKAKGMSSREQRNKGNCPLTPKEVGIFLNALGYPSNTPVYVAAEEVYGGESHLADLRLRYPLLMSKETLASIEELKPFVNHASHMAALDYIVSIESDVFIPSYAGDMAMAVEGHRRFLGHRKTITPDRRAVVRLFDKVEKGILKEGRKLSSQINEMHRRLKGAPRRRRGPSPVSKGMDKFLSEEVFYGNPLPDCLCRSTASLNVKLVSPRRGGHSSESVV